MDQVLNKYDAGQDQSYYLATLKFAGYQQLPVLLCGIAHRDAVLAKEAACKALDQWKATFASAAHNGYTKRSFADRVLV